MIITLDHFVWFSLQSLLLLPAALRTFSYQPAYQPDRPESEEMPENFRGSEIKLFARCFQLLSILKPDFGFSRVQPVSILCVHLAAFKRELNPPNSSCEELKAKIIWNHILLNPIRQILSSWLWFFSSKESSLTKFLWVGEHTVYTACDNSME